jgi:hypothetical protein
MLLMDGASGSNRIWQQQSKALQYIARVVAAAAAAAAAALLPLAGLRKHLMAIHLRPSGALLLLLLLLLPALCISDKIPQIKQVWTLLD